MKDIDTYFRNELLCEIANSYVSYRSTELQLTDYSVGTFIATTLDKESGQAVEIRGISTSGRTYFPYYNHISYE